MNSIDRTLDLMEVKSRKDRAAFKQFKKDYPIWGGVPKAALGGGRGAAGNTALAPLQTDDHDHEHGPQPTPTSDGFLQLPTQWQGTHPTDGLGWGTKTATDIMARAGTRVGAPEAGRVERWDPAGAQGGGSMWFISDSGRTYWIGHIANGVPAGTRVQRGQQIAVVSADHRAPHVHLDVR